METKKWFVRAGSMLLLLGFFLPCVVVSCSVTPEYYGIAAPALPYSLGDLASNLIIGQPLLFLVPLLMVVIIVFSFINLGTQERASYWGQVSSLLVSILIIALAAMNLQGQIDKTAGVLQIDPDYGAYVLAVGYGLILFGLIAQKVGSPTANRKPASAWSPPTVLPARPPAYIGQNPAFPPVGNPPGAVRLEVLSGAAPEIFPLTGDNLMIGRSLECHIHLSDPAVSRSHARLRYAQGSWFIQDQGSRVGIVVNGRPVSATRLNPGDQITLGGVTLIFNV